jgi:hypothetical protein
MFVAVARLNSLKVAYSVSDPDSDPMDYLRLSARQVGQPIRRL